MGVNEQVEFERQTGKVKDPQLSSHISAQVSFRMKASKLLMPIIFSVVKPSA